MSASDCVILSRAYDSDIAGGSGGLEQRVLIPLMDSLNHAGSRGPSVTFDCTNSVGGEDDVKKRRIPVGVASRAGGVVAGDELLSYYGAKPNWNFLTSYGFVSDEAASQETTLTASLDPSDGLFSAKREALARLGLASEGQLFDIQASKAPSPKVTCQHPTLCVLRFPPPPSRASWPPRSSPSSEPVEVEGRFRPCLFSTHPNKPCKKVKAEIFAGIFAGMPTEVSVVGSLASIAGPERS